ncbi:MAG: hypothetical protein KKC11_04185 [Candidatus Omnitrophica bacterium]|nr:hypothetical protein [Candidatus Omnitrophota bacterium]
MFKVLMSKFDKDVIKRIFFSLIYFSIAVLLFWLPKASQRSTVISENPEITVVEISDGIKTLCSTVAYFFLLLAGWLWKKELGINQFGIFGAPDEEPRNPTKEKPEPSNGYVNVEKDFLCDKFDQRKEEILEIAKEYDGIINGQIVAYELRISTKSAEILLWTLVKENKLRKDTYGHKSVYSLRDSLENRAIAVLPNF